MADLAHREYEYKSVKLWLVDDEYAKGWEPVPNVPIAPWANTSGASDNLIQIRRPLQSFSEWNSWKRRVRENSSHAG